MGQTWVESVSDHSGGVPKVQVGCVAYATGAYSPGASGHMPAQVVISRWSYAPGASECVAHDHVFHTPSS